jgi:2-methylfumaryl-CoA isomerase
MVAITRRQFADLTRITRLVGTFSFLERALGADFSACGELYVHRGAIVRLLAPWFARRTADVAAAFGGTSVTWDWINAPR